MSGVLESQALSHFVEEIRTAGQLEHPGIVPIYDVGIDEDGHYFFVMKCVKGETLEAIIQNGDARGVRRGENREIKT